jgi:hypothetical protein
VKSCCARSQFEVSTAVGGEELKTFRSAFDLLGGVYDQFMAENLLGIQ